MTSLADRALTGKRGRDQRTGGRPDLVARLRANPHATRRTLSYEWRRRQLEGIVKGASRARVRDGRGVGLRTLGRTPHEDLVGVTSPPPVGEGPNTR